MTEAVTGLDLVADQLRIAAGEPLGSAQPDVVLTGHAVEARLYAEDPWHGFLPATGHVLGVRWPKATGLRVDAGIGAGDVIGTRYDPLLAKLIAIGADRATALAVLAEALDETRVLGVTTNRGFLPGCFGCRRSSAARRGPTPSRPAGIRMPSCPSRRGRRQRRRSATRWTVVKSGIGAARSGFRLNGPRRLAIEIDGERRVHVGRRRRPAAATPSPTPAPRCADRASIGTGDGIVLDVDGRAVRARLAPPPTVEAALRAAHVDRAPPRPSRRPCRASCRACACAKARPSRPPGPARARGDEDGERHHRAGDGLVEHVLVRPGQAVNRGDVLVELAD